MIDIPDFASMSDADLHGWEFGVYEATPGDAELYQIIGIGAARDYYNERGRRLDGAEFTRITAEIGMLMVTFQAVATRLASGKSGQHHFPQAEVW